MATSLPANEFPLLAFKQLASFPHRLLAMIDGRQTTLVALTFVGVLTHNPLTDSQSCSRLSFLGSANKD